MSGRARSAPPAGDAAPTAEPAVVLARVPTGTTLRRELAAAARSRGRPSSFAAELSALHAELAAIETPAVDLEAARRRLADATGEEERLKERVAAVRGDVRARRAVGADTAASLADLEAAAAALSDAQTTRIAAEQALARERRRAAAARDERERRLGLSDRLNNRRRNAREELAAAVYPDFRAALSAVPGGDPTAAGAAVSEYDGSALAGSLAAVRIASLDGPVVLGRRVAAAFDAWDGPDPATALGVPVSLPEV